MLEANARAAAAVDEAATAKAAAHRAKAVAKCAEQAVGGSDQATDSKALTAVLAAVRAAATLQQAKAVAEVRKAEAALVRQVAVTEGVDVRPGSSTKRKREDARATLVAADADVAAVVDDMTTAIVAYHRC